jgi:2-oxoglutarate dehydrogenase E2 component (dihydrolipoamide succinyltransferase)
MSISVELPELGESVVEGTVARWLVKEGDSVEADQPIVEVTTDKVDAEIPSPVRGVVEAILVAEDEIVEVGAVLARIAPAGEAAAKPDAASAKSPEPTSSPAAPTAAAPEVTTAAPSPAVRDEPRATPVARRMAEDSGVALRAVEGSGPSGRIRKADVARASQRGAPAPASDRSRRAATPNFGHYAIQEGDEVVPMSPLRRLVAEHMVFSKQHAPHVGTVAEVDLGGVVEARNAAKRGFQDAHGVALTFLPFIAHATVRALREFPQLNASVLEDAIALKRDIHLGIAVETEKGLIVPVVRHADRLSVAGLATALEDLSSRARTKRLSADELKGGTFTLSNPGRDGNLYGFAIINQPQVGILRMGEIVKRPVVRSLGGENAIVIRPIMHLALSYDHRAVDGSPANAFLHRIRELLEEADFDL